MPAFRAYALHFHLRDIILLWYSQNCPPLAWGPGCGSATVSITVIGRVVGREAGYVVTGGTIKAGRSLPVTV